MGIPQGAKPGAAYMKGTPISNHAVHTMQRALVFQKLKN
jgi:hypothetical protein